VLVLVPGAWSFGLARRGTNLASDPRMVAQRYQELDAWRLANDLKQKVYVLVDRSPAIDDRRFSDQIKASAASAAANLAEGFALYRHPEFARHTRWAKSSLTETDNHVADGVDRRYWSPEEAQPLRDLAGRAIGACVRLLHYLETTPTPAARPRRKRVRTAFPKRER